MMETSRSAVTRSALHMGTIVTIRAVTDKQESAVDQIIDEAMSAIHLVEATCSRFDSDSELRRLSHQIGRAVPVSDVLFEATRFALAVAEQTDGALDPTIGQTLQDYGYTRHYLTGEDATDPSYINTLSMPSSFRDVDIDEDQRTIQLKRPMLLDLGAVAKGLAVDLAAAILRQHSFTGFLIDAGGDLFLSGTNEQGEAWRVGVRHPVKPNEVLCTLSVTDAAVCTSGGYERPSAVQEGAHHLINPRTGKSQLDVLSATVIAPFTMMADAFSTAAFILGNHQGIAWLEDSGGEGLLVDASLGIHTTKGMKVYIHGNDA